MVPKADSGAFLLLFLLVLTVTEPLRPGARCGGRGAVGAVCGGGAGPGGQCSGPGSPGKSLHPAGPSPRRAPARPAASRRAPCPGPCPSPGTVPRVYLGSGCLVHHWNFVLEGCYLWIRVPWSAACFENDGSESDVRGPT